MEFAKKRLNVSYVKLEFRLVFLEDCLLPEEKVSALRGGMGEMLLRQNCIRDRDCGVCPYVDECLVHRVFYTKMEKRPPFMKGEDSIGYLIECENVQTSFPEGESLFFYLTLFGKAIVNFAQYLQAFYQLGMVGLGGEHARYVIDEVINQDGLPILCEGQVFPFNCRSGTLYGYAMERMEELRKRGMEGKIVFHTPLTLKYRGEFIQEFVPEAIFAALSRRIMMMDYFAGVYEDGPEFADCPIVLKQKARRKTVRRYSSTQNSRVELKGIEGYVYFEDIPEGYLPYLLAGELIHIGKNSSFGFGRYRVY